MNVDLFIMPDFNERTVIKMLKEKQFRIWNLMVEIYIEIVRNSKFNACDLFKGGNFWIINLTPLNLTEFKFKALLKGWNLYWDNFKRILFLTIRRLDITPLFLYFPIAFFLLVAFYQAGLKFQLVRAYSQAIFPNFFVPPRANHTARKSNTYSHPNLLPLCGISGATNFLHSWKLSQPHFIYSSRLRASTCIH